MPYEMEEQEAIGRRIRRRRLAIGTTQADMAAALGKTQGWLSRVERGQIELDRAALINQIASVLHCHPNDLIGRPYAAVSGGNKWQVSAAATVRELRRYDLAPVFTGAPRSSAELWSDMRRFYRLRDAAAYTATLQEMPDLLREVRALVEVSTGHEQEEAFALYAVLCKDTHRVAHALGHAELVAVAGERVRWAAERSGDPLMLAVATYMRVWDTWTTADWEDGMVLADRALSGIEQLTDAADPQALRVGGMLHLRAAITAARDNGFERAQDRVGMARDMATRLEQVEEPVFDRYSLNFSAGNVTIHGIAIAVEAGDQVKALELNDQADQRSIDALPHSRSGHHHMDLSRALLWNGNRDKALDELLKAERLAPQLVRNHPMARSTLRQIVYAERASTREKLRGMSSRFHLDEQDVFA